MFKMEASTGEVTADHAANAKTAHPAAINKIGRIKLRFFFGPFAGLPCPDLTRP